MNINELIPGFVDHLRNERRLSEQTITSYRSDLRMFAAVVAKEIDGITFQDVRGWQRQQLDKYHINTVRRRMNALSTFYEWLGVEDMARENIARRAMKLLPPKRRTISRKTLPDELWRLFVTTPGECDRDTLAWLLLAWLGLRISEVRELQVEDIQDGRIFIRGKGKHERMLPVPPAVTDVLERVLAGRGNGHLLTDGKWGKKGFYEAFKAHCDKCGLPETVTPHWLRHTVLSGLAGTLNVFELRDWAGHVSTRTTEIYVQTSKKRLLSVMDHHPLSELES